MEARAVQVDICRRFRIARLVGVPGGELHEDSGLQAGRYAQESSCGGAGMSVLPGVRRPSRRWSSPPSSVT
jgi:hypothetical protein